MIFMDPKFFFLKITIFLDPTFSLDPAFFFTKYFFYPKFFWPKIELEPNFLFFFLSFLFFFFFLFFFSFFFSFFLGQVFYFPLFSILIQFLDCKLLHCRSCVQAQSNQSNQLKWFFSYEMANGQFLTSFFFCFFFPYSEPVFGHRLSLQLP